jgi:1,4-dihydroxy-2-naphthoate octaprenyltransferase
MSKSLVNLSRPIILLLAALTYSLGAGMAHYLGRSIRVAPFWLGGFAALALISSAFLFSEYFRLPVLPLAQGETPRQRERYRVTLLQVAYAGFTLAAVAVLTLLLTNSLNLSADIILILAALFLIAFAIPPFKVSETGYGELVIAITLGTFLPALSFLLQFGRFQRLLSFTTFPLTLLALSYLIICNFPTFADDQKMDRHTLLTRLTWQRAIPIHHILVLASFLLFAGAPLFGIPWSLVWPIFLALPFALIQIYWLQRIFNGGRTLWNFLTSLAAATFGLSAYLLALTYWIR